MRSVVTGILWAAAAACVVALVLYDARLSAQRRPGAELWKVHIAPWRLLSAESYTEAGNRTRRRVLALYGLTVAFALAALGLGDG